MLCQMSKYFGKCFGSSTRVPGSGFWLRCPSFLLSKFASQLKLIQSVVRVGILGICVTISMLRVLFSGFWVSEFPESWESGSHVPESRVSGSRVSGLRVPGPGSQVLILDYVLFTYMAKKSWQKFKYLQNENSF